MPTEDEPIVWSPTLDGKYTASVIWPRRTFDGVLRLHRVGPSYNAQWSPGADDVDSWRGAAIAFVDKLQQS